MTYDIKIRCLTGTRRFVDGPSPRWENEVHVITWCSEASTTAADARVRDLLAGHNPQLLGAWWEPRP